MTREQEPPIQLTSLPELVHRLSFSEVEELIPADVHVEFGDPMPPGSRKMWYTDRLENALAMAQSRSLEMLRLAQSGELSDNQEYPLFPHPLGIIPTVVQNILIDRMGEEKDFQVVHKRRIVVDSAPDEAVAKVLYQRTNLPPIMALPTPLRPDPLVYQFYLRTTRVFETGEDLKIFLPERHEVGEIPIRTGDNLSQIIVRRAFPNRARQAPSPAG